MLSSTIKAPQAKSQPSQQDAALLLLVPAVTALKGLALRGPPAGFRLAEVLRGHLEL
jgi:hypothetical protein